MCIRDRFDGPVSFSQKVTSSSPEGIEANSIFLQGDATVARKITIATGTPTIAGNPGDIVFNHEPPLGGTTDLCSLLITVGHSLVLSVLVH